MCHVPQYSGIELAAGGAHVGMVQQCMTSAIVLGETSAGVSMGTCMDVTVG